jgi:hypothetical protein
MAEQADARDLKSRSRNRVGVRFPLSAPFNLEKASEMSNNTDFKKEDVPFQEILSNTERFIDYSYFLRQTYLDNLSQGDTLTPLSWDTEQLKRDLYCEELREDTKRIFDELVLGELTDFNKANLIYDLTSDLESLQEMNLENLRSLTLNRVALDLAAKIYLARYIEAYGLNQSKIFNSEAVGTPWSDFGDSFNLLLVAEEGFDETFTPEYYYMYLTSKPEQIYY